MGIIESHSNKSRTHDVPFVFFCRWTVQFPLSRNSHTDFSNFFPSFICVPFVFDIENKANKVKPDVVMWKWSRAIYVVYWFSNRKCYRSRSMSKFIFLPKLSTIEKLVELNPKMVSHCIWKNLNWKKIRQEPIKVVSVWICIVKIARLPFAFLRLIEPFSIQSRN